MRRTRRDRGAIGSWDDGDASAPWLDVPARQRPGVSGLALTSIVAALLGPVGSIAAMVFAWAARREIAQPGSKKTGRHLASAGMLLGALLTIGWGAAMAAWVGKGRLYAQLPAPSASEPPAGELPAPPFDPPVASEPTTGTTVPQDTTVTRRGAILVIDVGIQTSSLRDELARQRATASDEHQKLIVMTQRADCTPCANVDTALTDPLMQTALADVRLVRIDAGVFREELDELKFPTSFVPSFFLPSLDLTPKDGIDGGEWDEDIARNMAPVLGAFVRERYEHRRRAWQPLPGTGVRL